MKEFWQQGRLENCFENGLSRQVWKMKIKNGRGVSNFFNLSSNMKLSITEYEFLKPEKFRLTSTGSNLGFYFCEKGNAKILTRETGDRFVQEDGNTGFFVKPEGTVGTLSIPGGSKTRIISIDIPVDEFFKFAGSFGRKVPHFVEDAVKESDSRMISESFKAAPAIQLIFNQILNIKVPLGFGGGLLMEAKSLELIANILLQIDNRGKERSSFIKLSKREKEGLYHVKNILENQMASPPSLGCLAASAGMNRMKLNQGFKQIFGKTVFSVLRDLRLETAKKILEKGEMNVTETSFFVGYSCLSHFTKAFKEYHGVNPKQYLLKNLH